MCTNILLLLYSQRLQTTANAIANPGSPVFPYPCFYAGDFNCRHANWGYDDNSPDGECLAGWASINCLALLYNARDAASLYSGAETLAPIQI